MFFRDPIAELQRIVEEVEQIRKINQLSLSEMTTNPEVFRGPLTLFEVRLRQYEWMNYAEQVSVDIPAN
ncbi:hypothetical protein ACI2OX_16550 [Bacillus sp. N9]